MSLTGKGRLPLGSGWGRDIRSLYQPIIPGGTNIIALAVTSFMLGRNTNVNIKWWSGEAWVYPPFLQKFLLNEAPSLESYSGIAFKATVQAGLAFGDVVFLDITDSTYKKASATDITTAPAKAIFIQDDIVMRVGFIRSARWNLVAGSDLFLSTSLGDISVSRPNVANNVIQPVGWVVSSDTIYFEANQVYLELA